MRSLLIPLFLTLLTLLSCSSETVPDVFYFEERGQMLNCTTADGQKDPEVYSVMLSPTDASSVVLFGVGSFRGKSTWVVSEAKADWVGVDRLTVNGEFALTDKQIEPYSLELTDLHGESCGCKGFQGVGYFEIDPNDPDADESCEIVLAPSNVDNY